LIVLDIGGYLIAKLAFFAGATHKRRRKGMMQLSGCEACYQPHDVLVYITWFCALRKEHMFNVFISPPLQS